MFDHSLHIWSSPLSLFKKMTNPVTGWKLFRPSAVATQAPPPHNTEHSPKPQASSGKRKALLIAVRSSSPSSKKQDTKDKGTSVQDRPLKGPHKDVKDMRALLIEIYGYAPEDITTLLDDEDLNHEQPTRVNILRAINALVKDAKPGDSFFFHFAGHSGQIPTNDPEEEDGMNEYIVTSDRKKILDDTLHKRLVEPLPPNSTLIAVMDSCHSCSLLDLKHFRCNRVFVPWLNRGKRRTMTLQYIRSRKQALFAATELPKRIRTFSGNHEPLPSIRSIFASSAKFANAKSSNTKSAARKLLTPLVIKTNVPPNDDSNPTTVPQVLCTSPIPRFCEGHNCNQSNSIDERSLKADVICISSSRDEQETWEDENGVSMTQIMVQRLRADSHPTLQELMSHISFAIYDAAYKRNIKAREYKKKYQDWVANRAKDAIRRSAQRNDVEIPMNGNANAESVEFKAPQSKKQGKPKRALSLDISNFQNPELSSHFPVDMNRKWNV